jgi:3-oxoacyl-[acyl-carrier-protein] synthase II
MSASRLERPARPQKRVVVTGVGLITPLALNLKESWSAAISGKSGIAQITKFDSSAFDVHFAGEVKDFNADLYIEKKEQKKMDTFIHYALACTKMALDDANLKLTEDIAAQTGCYVGVGMGGLPMIEEQYSKLKERGPSRLSPFFIPAVITNLASGQITIAHGLKGPNYSVTSACASGAHAIGEAVRVLRDGTCDVMIAGGSEATVCPMAIGGFAAMRALSTRNNEPQKASRPWDKDRDGFVLGEGAAILILETLEHAEKRGAQIVCEVTGYGASSDGYHMTTPAPEGAGAAASMKAALKEANLRPDDIQYINAHGTSTPVGDGLETAAIKKVFESHAKKLWVSSTKSMTGHTLGAAGAIESAFCVMSLKDQIVPPTLNLDSPSDDCDLDYVPHQARVGKINHVLNNSFGFGGTNASLIFSKI